MFKVRQGLKVALSGGLLLGACADAPDEAIEVGVNQQALGACNETVPANRYIDGIPAYAQCDITQNSAIFSNNGVDTATTSQGAGWVRTQYSGGYQCTELAGRYLTFKWNVKWRPNGNAGQWCDTTPPANSGMVQTMVPVHGDLMVLAPGSCGAAQSTGHVVVVDVVDTAKAKLTVLEQNGARRGTYMQSCAKCFLHVVANDGTNPGNTIAPSTGAPMPVAGAGTATPPVVAGAAAPDVPSNTAAGATARPSRGPAPAGSPAVTPPPTASTPPAANSPAAAGPAGSTAVIPLVVPGAAGSPAAAPASTRPRAPEPQGCSVSGLGTSQPSAAGFTVLAALGLLSVRRRTQRSRARSRG